MEKIRLIISKCLLGDKVRYNGGHKKDLLIKEIIGKYTNFLPVCPEVECGLSIPRDPMILVKNKQKITLISKTNKTDYTNQITTWIYKKIEEIKKEDIDGFIFKSKSPSCGLKVSILDNSSKTIFKGEGLWAKSCKKNFPDLPKIEEISLYNFYERDNFFSSIFVIKQFKTIQYSNRKEDLKKFHYQHKLFLKSKDPKIFHKLDKCFYSIIETDINSRFIEKYKAYLINILNKKITKKFYINLYHNIISTIKKECPLLKKTLDLYKLGDINEIYLIETAKHYILFKDIKTLKEQFYIKPNKLDFGLRFLLHIP